MAKRYQVLISAPYMIREKDKVQPYLQSLPINFHWGNVHERYEEKELLEIIEPYDAIICGDDRFTRAVYDKAKNLKVIVKWGTGIDSLNKPEADKRGIKFYRTLEAFTIPVADTTLGLILSFIRNIHLNDSILKKNGWDKPFGSTLSERTVGIIGYGSIGQAVAKRISAFGSKILVYDIVKKSEDCLTRNNCVQVDLDFLFKNSDIITLHCDLNESSQYILNKSSFLKMEKNPIIINTARGPLIKEDDLIEALEKNMISFAGLDVFEVEPLPLTSPLRKSDRVLLSAHNSNSSPHFWDKVHRNSIKCLMEGLDLV